jgi:hypothetical protein
MAVAGRAAEWKALRGSLPSGVAGLQPVGSLPDETRLDLALGLPLRNKQALAGLLEEIYDPASPKFHHYLTPAQFVERFSPSEQDYRSVVDFARANRMTITGLHANRTLLDVQATAADIRRVFRVNMKVYPHPTQDRTFYAPDAAPSIRADLPVLAIIGLDNFTAPHSDVKKKPIESPSTPGPLAGSGPGGAYVGKDFRAAYVPGVTITGAGQTVALVEFDGYYPSDIAGYQSMAHLPAVSLTNVLVNGYGGSAGANNLEVALDIEMLLSMAPGLSRIMVYEEQLFDPVDDVLNRIATDNAASQISCSWNFFNMDAVTDQIFQQYAAQGQSFFCAAGDVGAYAGGQVTMPAGDPYITVVGGTVLSVTGAGGAWQSETAWHDGSGGFSTNYAIPSWQTGVGTPTNQGSTAFRNLPDVAMCASNVVVVYNNGTTNALWGTSCAAPLWAGLTALINQQAAQYGNPPVGFLNPALYSLGAGPGYATNFHDITTGNNTNSTSAHAYFAVAGYDLCTGWGTPNGANLINSLAPPDTLLMLPISGFLSGGPGGGPFSLTADSYALTNTGSAALDWSVGSDASWLSVAPTNGTINPGEVLTVVLNLNSTASNLPAGNYTGSLTLTNLSDGLTHSRSLDLRVSDPLSIAPAAGFTFGGPPSGPFNEAAQICELTNASQSSVNWSLADSPAWLTASPASGTLAPGGSAAVSCALNAAATNLPPGVYSAQVLFTNLSYGAQEDLPALFVVGQLFQNGGFETGSLADWTLAGFTSYVFANTSPTCVHSGTYGVDLETAGAAPGYLSQTIPTVPGQLYLVSLWLDSPDGKAPNWFMLSWGGDAVFDETNLPALGWTNLQFTLAATNESTVVEIGFQNTGSYFGFDDMSVTAAAPALSSVTPASGPVAGGTTVAISGTGFQSHATVAFGSAPAASVLFNAASNLMVVTPAGAVGPVNVTITNADGQVAVLTNGFVFVGTPVITWTNPPPVTYGASLGPGQLNATANLPGAFAYNPPAGTVLDAGTNTLAALFTPNDTVDYDSVTNFVSLTVWQAPLSVTASDATRPYGLTNPVFTGNIAGLQNGDDITASYSCQATSASPAGTYPIAPILLDPGNRLPNYQVSIIDGTLTVLAPVPPAFQMITQNSNVVSFTWSAAPGETYQVQFASSLDSTNWADLGGIMTATNATLTATDSVADSQCFYRVLLVPQ